MCKGTCLPGPHWLFTDRSLSRSPQIREGMSFHCTAALFTTAIRSHGFDVLCISPSAYASYDVFVYQLTVLLAASSGPDLAVKLLPFASSWRLITTMGFNGDLFTGDVQVDSERTQSHQFDSFTLLS